MAKRRGEMLERTEIKIPFEHLSPAVQNVLGMNVRTKGTIKQARFLRGASEVVGPFAAGIGVGLGQVGILFLLLAAWLAVLLIG